MIIRIFPVCPALTEPFTASIRAVLYRSAGSFKLHSCVSNTVLFARADPIGHKSASFFDTIDSHTSSSSTVLAGLVASLTRSGFYINRKRQFVWFADQPSPLKKKEAARRAQDSRKCVYFVNRAQQIKAWHKKLTLDSAKSPSNFCGFPICSQRMA